MGRTAYPNGALRPFPLPGPARRYRQTEVILMSESIALVVFALAFIGFWLVAMTSALSGLRED